MSSGFKQEVLVQTAHSMPSAIVLSASLDVFWHVLGGIFICLQIAYLIWKWRKEAKKHKNEED